MRTSLAVCALAVLAGCASPADAIRQKSEAAGLECQAKRLAGELPSYAASFHCSAPPIRQAHVDAGYPYMDLVDLMLAQREVLAERLDRGKMTETEFAAALAELNSTIQSEAIRRDQGEAARRAAVLGVLLSRPAAPVVQPYQLPAPAPMQPTGITPFSCTRLGETTFCR